MVSSYLFLNLVSVALMLLNLECGYFIIVNLHANEMNYDRLAKVQHTERPVSFLKQNRSK